MDEPARLLADGGDHRAIAVAQAVHSDAGGEVEIAAAGAVEDARPAPR